jgi:hypothetical protein
MECAPKTNNWSRQLLDQQHILFIQYFTKNRHPGESRDPCFRQPVAGEMDPGFRREGGSKVARAPPLPPACRQKGTDRASLA